MVLLFYYLSLFNLADAALTVAGIESSLISEANPLMGWIYSIDLGLFIALKLLLSATLLLFIFYKKVPTSKIVKALTIFAASIYTAVMFIHSFWLISLI